MKKARTHFCDCMQHFRVSVLLLATFAIFTAGCASTSSELDRRRKQGSGPWTATFIANYEDVVEAVNRVVVNRYNVQKDDSDAGIYESQFVKGTTRFKAPFETDPLPVGYMYRISIRYVRVKDMKSGVRVQIIKQGQIRRDFFSEPQPVVSDGFEEQILLYRIRREIEIKKAIARYHERENEKLRKSSR